MGRGRLLLYRDGDCCMCYISGSVLVKSLLLFPLPCQVLVMGLKDVNLSPEVHHNTHYK